MRSTKKRKQLCVPVTGEMVTSLDGRISGYRVAIGERQSSVAARIAGRKTLEELFAEVDRVLGEEIDKYLELFRGSEPEFYNAYFSARTIKKFGVRHEVKPVLTAVRSDQPDTKKAA